MPIHSVLIINTAGMLVFTKYCDHMLPQEERALWERVVFRNSKHHWKEAESQTQFFIVRDEVSVVYRAVNDLIVFVAGSDDCDELLLSELITVVIDLISSACDKKSTEKGLLEGDAYGKFSVLLDQMMPQGIIDHVNVDVLERLAKLKSMT